MGMKQSKKASKRSYKQKSFASESEVNHLITPKIIKVVNFNEKYDSMTIDRIHSHHYLLKHIWEGNFSSPIHPSLESGTINALEIKCGPGTWILDMATEFPDCSFTGIDVIQIFPSEIKPKNTKFVLVNQPEHLPFSTSTFSYIRVNFIEHTCMYQEHLFCQSNIINEIVKIMKSGAWLEITTWSMEFENFGSVTQKLISALISCFENYVPSETISSLLSSQCEKLKEINILKSNIPIGKWAGLIGELVMQDLLITFKKYSDEICKKLDTTQNQYDSFLEDFIKEIEENHTVFKTYRFYGQKI